MIAVAVTGPACGGADNTNTAGNQQAARDCSVGNDTPTEAYKRLYAAVKSKSTESIKSEMTKKSHDFADGLAARQNKPVEEIYVNGFTATTFAETLPEIRDERIAPCNGAVEVRNAKDQRWEDLPFIAEDGKWKFAIGEMFADTFKSPGKGRDTKEREAANAAGGNNMPEPTNKMANSNTSTMSNRGKSPKYDGPQVEPLPKNK